MGSAFSAAHPGGRVTGPGVFQGCGSSRATDRRGAWDTCPPSSSSRSTALPVSSYPLRGCRRRARLPCVSAPPGALALGWGCSLPNLSAPELTSAGESAALYLRGHLGLHLSAVAAGVRASLADGLPAFRPVEAGSGRCETYAADVVLLKDLQTPCVRLGTAPVEGVRLNRVAGRQQNISLAEHNRPLDSRGTSLAGSKNLEL